jgi:hypothetical protein
MPQLGPWYRRATLSGTHAVLKTGLKRLVADTGRPLPHHIDTVRSAVLSTLRADRSRLGPPSEIGLADCRNSPTPPGVAPISSFRAAFARSRITVLPARIASNVSVITAERERERDVAARDGERHDGFEAQPPSRRSRCGFLIPARFPKERAQPATFPLRLSASRTMLQERTRNAGSQEFSGRGGARIPACYR